MRADGVFITLQQFKSVMTKSIKWGLVFFIAIVAISGAYLYWKNKIMRTPVIVDGGACIYDTTILPAKVASVLMDSNPLVYIKVEMKTKDSIVHVIDLNQTYRQTFGKNEWMQSGIKEGDVITCFNYTIKSGGCSPEIFFFTLKKYGQ